MELICLDTPKEAGQVTEVAKVTEITKVPEVQPAVKRKLIVYLLVSFVSFVVLVMPSRAGVTVPIFVIVQAAMIYGIGFRQKQIIVLLPIFVLALNAFISANPMWRVVNVFVAASLYGVMALDTWSNGVLLRVTTRMVMSFSRIVVPVKWAKEARVKDLPMLRRVMIGVALSIPALIFIVVMLSRADTIFYETVAYIIGEITSLIHASLVWRILVGVVAGLYLFGIMYNIFAPKGQEVSWGIATRKGDCVILGVVLSSVLLVYTLFVVIQFRYLFAPPYNLPYGLCFVTYARRGFFELLFLTAVNVAFILVTVWLTKTQEGRGAKTIKILCMYLCAVTVILLVSSFYRMWLYSSDDGLTRMRLLVFGFLFFELIGLIFTFVHIMKPKFNILPVYALIALSYFLLLNLVPIDRIIARDQINRYFETGHGGIQYVLTLSPDAAPEIVRLLNSPNQSTRTNANSYLFRLNRASVDDGWRQWNLAGSHARRLAVSNVR